MSFSLENEIALVTGASRGIGKSTALALGKQGATVVGTATSDKGAEAISAYLAEAGIKGKGMVLNVTDSDSIDACLKVMETDFGMPTILVNNAGITRDNLLMRMKDEEWDDIINTNLTSIYRLSKAVLRTMMKARKGRIISITSVVGAMGNAGQTNYAAAKAGDGLYQGVGPRGRIPRHYRQCRRPRFHRHGYDQGAAGRAEECPADTDPYGASGYAGRDCRCGDLPGFTRGRLHHRHYFACEWRYVHVLKMQLNHIIM